MSELPDEPSNPVEPVVFTRRGTVFANSRDVAKFFEKEHRHVLRDIDNLIAEMSEGGLLNFEQGGLPNSGEGGMPNFGHTPYVDPQNGRTYRSFDMDRDGFTLLAMGFTGPRALKWKLRYIAAFNAMEATLKAGAPAPGALTFEQKMRYLEFIRDTLTADDVRMAARGLGLPVGSGGGASPPLALPAHEIEPGPTVEDGRRCLALLSGYDLAGETIAELIRAQAKEDVKAMQKLLQFGIHTDWDAETRTTLVAISAQNQRIHRIFMATPWNHGLWDLALLQLPGARAIEIPARKTQRRVIRTRPTILLPIVLFTAS
ncbi:Rha family transcriptional regulator [Aureimonas sp. D3]|uniref:Rha family transcriptional regulator n=1 Tax=Aureimonas sp. D3 TaxID=1638164 RepID=UPI000782C5A7|nr:Rha family transcriptional regulator [Aureimonas sp. D3]